MTTTTSIIPTERIEKRILLIRAEKVILDADLAELYGVTTKRLNEQVKRNRGRFPPDFVFQLTASEKSALVANCDHLTNLKYSRTNPYAFTEHGVIMVAGILNTPKAIEMSIFVVRTFVKLRQLFSTHKALRDKLTEIEQKVGNHDQTIQVLIDAIQKLMKLPENARKRPIGFVPWSEKETVK